MNHQETKETKKTKAVKYKNLSDYSTVGYMFPASIGVGLAIGYYLDKYFDTHPYLIIIFTLYGVGAGFWNLIKVTRPRKNEEKNK
ncbi:MAG: AtpZ/AtpI family protein [bacterium]|nr:AtpZ/AtpI family protein [bacterium]